MCSASHAVAYGSLGMLVVRTSELVRVIGASINPCDLVYVQYRVSCHGAGGTGGVSGGGGEVGGGGGGGGEGGVVVAPQMVQPSLTIELSVRRGSMSMGHQ